MTAAAAAVAARDEAAAAREAESTMPLPLSSLCMPSHRSPAPLSWVSATPELLRRASPSAWPPPPPLLPWGRRRSCSVTALSCAPHVSLNSRMSVFSSSSASLCATRGFEHRTRVSTHQPSGKSTVGGARDGYQLLRIGDVKVLPLYKFSIDEHHRRHDVLLPKRVAGGDDCPKSRAEDAVQGC